MQLTRRTFGKTALAFAAAPALLTLEGCTYTKADLIADAGIVDKTVSAILTVLGVGALASEIQGYLTQFDSAVNAWDGSSTSGIIISILGDIELALGDVGLPILIVGAADAAISGIELLIENLSKGASTVANPAVRPSQAQAHTSLRTRPAPATSRRQSVVGWNKAIVGTPLSLYTLHVPMF